MHGWLTVPACLAHNFPSQVLGLPASTARCDAIAAVAAAVPDGSGPTASTHVFLGMSDGRVLHARLHAQPSTL
eukprot:COSAG01_NODE_26865_length_701_cov_0.765781_1_plen_73_part_00